MIMVLGALLGAFCGWRRWGEALGLAAAAGGLVVSSAPPPPPTRPLKL